MKTNRVGWIKQGIISCLLLLAGFGAIAQPGKVASIAPLKITITHNKTTNLVFPYAIKSVDRGSKDILIQKVLGVENVLQIKSVKAGFEETNLTVVTADGSLYSCLLKYADQPAELNIAIDNSQSMVKPAAIFTGNATNDIIGKTAQTLINRKPVIRRPRDHKGGVSVQLNGIYIQEDVLYLHLGLGNESAIAYDMQPLRLAVMDKKKSKRTASQELVLQPLHVAGNTARIGTYSQQGLVLAIARLTIPAQQYIALELMERGGGRHLRIRLSNKQIMAAMPVR